MHTDDNVTTIHHYTDSEIVHIVLRPEKNSSDENEEGVREQISIDRLIQSCSHFVTIYTGIIYSQGTKHQ